MLYPLVALLESPGASHWTGAAADGGGWRLRAHSVSSAICRAAEKRRVGSGQARSLPHRSEPSEPAGRVRSREATRSAKHASTKAAPCLSNARPRTTTAVPSSSHGAQESPAPTPARTRPPDPQRDVPWFPGSSGAVHSWRLQQHRTTVRPRPARPMTGHVAPRAALPLVCRLYRLCRGLQRIAPPLGDQGTAGDRRGYV
jgi:hypothetical protein